MCIEIPIQWACCHADWAPDSDHEVQHPIWQICDTVTKALSEVDLQNEVSKEAAMACANRVRGRPENTSAYRDLEDDDDDEVDHMLYPGCCSACLENEAKVEELRGTLCGWYRKHQDLIKEAACERSGEGEPGCDSDIENLEAEMFRSAIKAIDPTLDEERKRAARGRVFELFKYICAEAEKDAMEASVREYLQLEQSSRRG